MNRSRTTALAAATMLLGLAGVGYAPTASAATSSLVAQGAYSCQAAVAGSDNAKYGVTLRMQLNAPQSVAPGQKVSLAGTLTMQFDQTLYNNAHLIGVSKVDGYSTTLSVSSQTNGKRTPVIANRWQTSPAPLTNPIVVSAPISFPTFTVPSNASGDLVLGLPANGTTKNSVSSSPSTVAFNAIANANYSAGSLVIKLACYVASGAPGTLGKIPISAAGSGSASSGTSSTSGSSTTTGAAGTTATGTTGATSSGSLTSDDSSTAGDSAASDTTSTAGGTTTTADGTTTGTVAAQQVAATTRTGVYVPTSVLVLGGALVCLLALGYAGLTNHRIRMIQRALDD